MKNTTVEQNIIDELVQTFYHNLLQKPSFKVLFAERDVNMDQLIERQKDFIGRLVNKEGAEQDTVHQIKNRHSFTINPERSNVWIQTMRETVNTLEIDTETKQHILTKIQYLYDNM